MNMEKNYGEMKLDIRTEDVKMNDYLERKIHNMIKKLTSLRLDINWMEINLKQTGETTLSRTVSVRFGIAGFDFQASDTDTRWKVALKEVEIRLIQQVEKRRALLLKMAS